MFSFLNKSKKEEVLLFLYISNGSIDIATIHISKKEKPIILSSIHKSINLDEEKTFVDQIAKMERVLRETLVDFRAKQIGFFVVDKVLCSISSTWQFSEIRKIIFREDSSFVVTKKFWEDILAKDRKEFENSVFKNHHEKDHAVKIIEQHIVSVCLNGYPVSNPIGRSTKSFECSYIISLSEKRILDHIKENIGKYIGTMPLVFISDVFLLHEVSQLIKDPKKDEDCIVFNIDRESTNIIFVINNIISSSVSFTFGTSVLFEKIIRSLGVSKEEAESLVSIHRKNGLDIVTEKKINEIILNTEKEWVDRVRKVFADVSHNFSIPNNILFLSDSIHSRWLEKSFNGDYFKNYMFSGRVKNVTNLESKLFNYVEKVSTVHAHPIVLVGAIFASSSESSTM